MKIIGHATTSINGLHKLDRRRRISRTFMDLKVEFPTETRYYDGPDKTVHTTLRLQQRSYPGDKKRRDEQYHTAKHMANRTLTDRTYPLREKSDYQSSGMINKNDDQDIVMRRGQRTSYGVYQSKHRIQPNGAIPIAS
jgi:hypothetical protein